VSGPAGPKDRTGIWVVPVVGGTLKKLQEDAWGAVLSPDNTRIAFGRASAPEIWLVNVSGEGLRRLVTAPPGYGISGEALAWSPDGQQIAFGRTKRTGTEVTIQSYDLASGRTATILSDPQIENFCWAPDGRLIYSRREKPTNQRTPMAGLGELQPLGNQRGFPYSANSRQTSAPD
jgi:Tol biopolymer transport system component